MPGFETGWPVTPVTLPDGGPQPRRAVVKVALLTLAAGLLAVVVATAVAVASHWQSELAGAPASPSPSMPPIPSPGVREPLPTVYGGTVAEVVANGEAVGATVVVFDARSDRPVGSDWRVCTRGEAFIGEDVPSGELHVAAVPPGDPCP